MIFTGVYLDPELHAKMKEIASGFGITVSDFLRDAIKEKIAQFGDLPPKETPTVIPAHEDDWLF